MLTPVPDTPKSDKRPTKVTEKKGNQEDKENFVVPQTPVTARNKKNSRPLISASLTEQTKPRSPLMAKQLPITNTTMDDTSKPLLHSDMLQCFTHDP